MILTLERLTKYYGANLILKDISLKIEDTDRIGLIGRNGAGKSTLLEICKGDLEFEEGVRSVGSGATIGFLRQNSGLQWENTIEQEMQLVFASLLQAQARMEEIHGQMDAFPHESEQYHALTVEYTALEAQFIAGDGYQIQVKINTVLNGMGFLGKDRATRISTLSGGEKTRLALCKLLLENPSLLILDEPTNHLDFKTLLWLEDYLKSYKGALLIVSHDRYFLDSLVTSICEVDRTRITRYAGNYSKYLTLREDAFVRQQKLYEAQQEEIARLQEYVDKNLVRATTSKSAKSKRKAIEHMELVEKPLPPLKRAHFTFEYDREPVKDVLFIDRLAVEVGVGERRKLLFDQLDFAMTRGEKIALIGPNGVGKSSLLKALMGLIPPRGGQVTWGRNVQVSYYEQENTSLHPEKTVLDELWDRYPRMYELDIRNTLGSVLHTGEDVYQTVASLSGGERAKLQFAIMLLERGNFLILDEPTNHLDLDTKEVLDDALTRYTGTVLMVSHDRYLLSKMPTKIIEMGPEGLTIYPGKYGDYLAAKERQQSEKPPAATVAAGEAKADNGYHRSKKQRAQEAQSKARLLVVEKELALLEGEMGALQEEIATPEIAADYEALAQRLALLEEKNQQLETLYEEWMGLQEKDEG